MQEYGLMMDSEIGIYAMRAEANSGTGTGLQVCQKRFKDATGAKNMTERCLAKIEVRNYKDPIPMYP